MDHFTPVSAVIGGALLGLGASLLLLLNGRVAGISGIAGGLVENRAGDVEWRWAFLGGLAVGAWALGALAPQVFSGVVTQNVPRLAVAGLLVGFGSRLAGGCTSGHGICGLARFSGRSLAATVTFMATAAGTVFALRHLGVGG